MDNEKIWGKLSRHLTGAGDSKLEEEINEWKQSTKRNQNVFKVLEEVWNHNPFQTYDSSSIYRKFRIRVNQYEKASRTRSFIYYGLRISAIVIVLFSISILVQKFIIPESKIQICYNEIFVPKGNRTSIVLPDSSKVWIANGTNLRYPYQFSKTTRELYLSGEAYFEVTHNEKKPFIVNIGKNRIEVLGTKFSVSAYPDDDIVKADLISGKIQFDIHSDGTADQFKSFIVKPGHSFAYNKAVKAITDSEIQDGFYDYWLKGVYTFKNESLASLAKKVARIYNIEMVFEDEFLKNKCYNGSLSVNDNIYNFIEAVKQTSVEPIAYRLEMNKLYIKLNKPN